jgi:hypothetical protein
VDLRKQAGCNANTTVRCALLAGILVDLCKQSAAVPACLEKIAALERENQELHTLVAQKEQVGSG